MEPGVPPGGKATRLQLRLKIHTPQLELAARCRHYGRRGTRRYNRLIAAAAR